VSDETSESTSAAPSGGLTKAEIALRRYEARLGVWKVVLSTFIVGLAGVLIPGAISFYTAYFDNERKKTELALSQQAAHQQYIKEFFTTAINEDIELRIRFAQYFANLTATEQQLAAEQQQPALLERPCPTAAGHPPSAQPQPAGFPENPWQRYFEGLKCLRDANHEKISSLETEILNFDEAALTLDQAKRFEQIKRELQWARDEIGAATPASATVRISSRKSRLYGEATDIVHRLASTTAAIPTQSPEIDRFWELYRRELIGIESPEFSRTMVAIGRALSILGESKSPPDDELKALVARLEAISQEELLAEAQSVQLQQSPPQQQQMQQQQMPEPSQAQ